jgi:hypothetical protein
LRRSSESACFCHAPCRSQTEAKAERAGAEAAKRVGRAKSGREEREEAAKKTAMQVGQRRGTPDSVLLWRWCVASLRGRRGPAIGVLVQAVVEVCSLLVLPECAYLHRG